MDDSEKVPFGLTIGAMLEAFGQESTKPRLLGYWLGLRDLSLSQVQEGVAEAIRSSTRLPLPADLRTLATGGDSESHAIVAWADVLKAMPHGSYRHIDFEDRLINAVIRSLGGWPAMLERCSSADSEKWVRLEFLKAYRVLRDRGVSEDACQPLPGLSEVQCIGGKIRKPIPKRIACDDARRDVPKLIDNTHSPLRIGSP